MAASSGGSFLVGEISGVDSLAGSGLCIQEHHIQSVGLCRAGGIIWPSVESSAVP